MPALKIITVNLTAREAARRVGISPRTLRGYAIVHDWAAPDTTIGKRPAYSPARIAELREHVA